MSTISDLVQAITANSEAVTALQTEIGAVAGSVTTEISRVESVIASLKTGNTIDQATLDQAVADLTTAKTNLGASVSSLTTSQSALDAEQATPASPAPTTPAA